MSNKTYSGDAQDMAVAKLPKGIRFVSAGYVEKPLKGQWYLSGAKPRAYRAPNNLSQEHVIAYPVRLSPNPNYAPTLVNPYYVP